MKESSKKFLEYIKAGLDKHYFVVHELEFIRSLPYFQDIKLFAFDIGCPPIQ